MAEASAGSGPWHRLSAPREHTIEPYEHHTHRVTQGLAQRNQERRKTIFMCPHAVRATTRAFTDTTSMSRTNSRCGRQPLLRQPHRSRRRPEDHRPRRTAYVRLAPGRPGRAPPGRDGDPQARGLLHHDGDLQPGLIQDHPGSPAEARSESRSMTRCCTSLLYKIERGHPEDPGWPLNCVGTAGFELTTPCCRPTPSRTCR